jgi:hypothetical protein
VTLLQQSRFAGRLLSGLGRSEDERWRACRIGAFEVLKGLLCWAVEREGGGLSCRRGARIALTLGCGLGRPCGGLVEPWIQHVFGSDVLHARSMSTRACFVFMPGTTNRRWQALRASPR